MTKTQEKVTVLISTATTDDGQPPAQHFNNSISDEPPESNQNFETAADKEHP